eukprot:2497225-Pleurochrysis_carterae.AAC.1
MGVFKELVIDHSLDGEMLPHNIVIVAAGNPARARIDLTGDRREELGSEWVIGHYQVHPLPASMQQMSWDFGSLKPAQEQEFIQKKLCFLTREKSSALSGDYTTLTESEVRTLGKLVHAAQQKTREFAQEQIRTMMLKQLAEGAKCDEAEIAARASSAVSLRDILRVFHIYTFVTEASPAVSDVLLPGAKTPAEKRHCAMLLALAGGTARDFAFVWKQQACLPTVQLALALIYLLHETWYVRLVQTSHQLASLCAHLKARSPASSQSCTTFVSGATPPT